MSHRRFALVDVNNCYVSCERLMRPDLATTPMVVLSNGDGCCVARGAEVKALGVQMGMPWHQMQDLARQHGIIGMSSNYALYGDMSRRFHSILATYVAPEDAEIYSIDESWLDFSAQPRLDLTETGHAIKAKVQQWLGLPVSCGAGPTKTLAKFASHCAKKQPRWGGVCDLTVLTAPDRLNVMKGVEVREVWGVGRRIAARLMAGGVATMADLAACEPRRIRERFGVVMERTCRELQGVSCIDIETEPPPKQQIIASRSFGAPVFSLQDLAEPIRFHMGTASAKLRAQESVAGTLGVWIETNQFRPQDPQYSPSRTVTLPVLTDDTATLTGWSVALLSALFKPGFRYVKAGVMLMDLRPAGQTQGSLFEYTPPEHNLKREHLMATLDSVNGKWGRGCMGIGSDGIKEIRTWTMRQGNLSPRYTTRWEELRVVS